MAAANIVKGQRVQRTKLARSRELRRTPTAAERVIWHHLRGHRLAGLGFRRQQVIDGLIVDFYCHTASLVVEVDGAAHSNQADYDAERDRVLAAHGLRVLHVTNDEVMTDLQSVLRRIHDTALQTDLRPHSPLPSGEGPGVGSAPAVLGTSRVQPHSPLPLGEGPGVGSAPATGVQETEQ